MQKPDPATAATALTKELVVQNKMGIHARPAAMIVRVTNKFKSDVFVEKDEEQVNGKSIMGLMMLAAGKGSRVKFIVTGEDAAQMLVEIDALFVRKFDEPGPDVPTPPRLCGSASAQAGRDHRFGSEKPKSSQALRVLASASRASGMLNTSEAKAAVKAT